MQSREREGERLRRRSWMREDDRCPLLPKCACLIPPVYYLKGFCVVARKLFLLSLTFRLAGCYWAKSAYL